MALHAARRGRRICTSALTTVEARRTMANLVAGQRVGIEHAADLLERALRIFAGADVRQVDEDVLARAAGAFPLPIATLDAIHVATALEVQQWHDVTELVLLSRDKQVRDVAAALGMQLA